MSQQIHDKLTLLSLFLRIPDVVQMSNVVNALYDTAQKEWDNGFNAQTGEHLVKGVFTSSVKTDFVQMLVAKLVAQYSRSFGVQGNAWTKNTISSENFTNVAITGRIAATEYADIRPLFDIILTRLIGLDNKIVEFALAATVKEKALALVQYIASQFDLSDSFDKIQSEYTDTVRAVEELLEKNLMTPELYLAGVNYIYQEFVTVEDETIHFGNPLDAITHFFDLQLSKAQHDQ